MSLLIINCFHYYDILFVDFVMIAVILISRRLHVNPDNVATPLAASVGDVVSITLLANVASLLYAYMGIFFYISLSTLMKSRH